MTPRTIALPLLAALWLALVFTWHTVSTWAYRAAQATIRAVERVDRWMDRWHERLLAMDD